MAKDNKDSFDKFTHNARRSLVEAQKIARELRNSAVGTEHLLLGMLAVKESLAAEILAQVDVTAQKVFVLLSFGTRSSSTTVGGVSRETGVGLTLAAKEVLERAVNYAKKYGHFYIGTEHIMLGILDGEECEAKRILERVGVDIKALRVQVEGLFSAASPEAGDFLVGEEAGKKGAENSTLEYFTTDLTEKAREGKLDPVIGRSKEIDRVIQILNRRTKNNPVLIGEAGVGKTAIVEGLAQRMIDGEVPRTLLNKKLLMLDLTSLIAGTKYRGEFEDRMKQLIVELRKSNDAVLFIDELHSIVGAGQAEGSLDAGGILKPALARGELQCIGATTLDEYKKHLERDSALERRFQPVIVEEPSIEDTIKILQGVKANYEEHHKVEITDEAIEAAAKLSFRYLPDRRLPDKAVDLIDEAASLARIKAGFEGLDIAKLEKKLRKVVEGKDAAVDSQNFEEAARLKAEELNLKAQIENSKKQKAKGSVAIGKFDVAGIISAWTGIPVINLVKGEAERFLHLEEALGQRIVGQDEAIRAVASSLKRSRVGIASPNRPIGSFIFLGPTGVGKTELVKVLAETVFERKNSLVKIDMSEFMERHNVSRLVGAPPGYVGYEEAGKLTEAVRRNPYSVVLLDEIEKAHPEVFNMLLQIFDDGYLTDARGKRVDFRNTVVVMTSNIGMQEFSRLAEVGFRAQGEDEQRSAEERYGAIKAAVLGSLKETFRPEFLNRIDKVVVFQPLKPEDIRKITEIEVARFAEHLQEQGIKIEATVAAIEHIAQKGYDPENGARPIRRVIAQAVEDPLAEGILAGKFSIGSAVVVDVVGAEIVLKEGAKNVAKVVSEELKPLTKPRARSARK